MPVTMADFATRLPIYEQIEISRSTKVISYVTGDRRQMETQIHSEVVDLFVDHLDAIGPVKKISLLIYTTGGDTAAAWRLINLLRTFCDDLEVLIPMKALSAGTLISLGSNLIVMTKQAALGPIDPSINHPLAPQVPGAPPHVKAPVSVEAVRGYLDAARHELGIKGEREMTTLLTDLSSKVHPLVLGQIFRSISQIRILARKLLKYQLDDENKIQRIIDFLCAESGSHDYTINRREARDLGLIIETPSSEFYTQLNGLHKSFRDELRLLEPYDPYNVLGTSQRADYSFPRAIIESCNVGCHQFVSEGILMKMEIPTPSGILQHAVNDHRKFDGWRKIS
jgi:Serine dehydrogenase proteinase